MKNIKIWHTPDEKPDERKDIFFYTKDSPYLHEGFLIGSYFYDDPDTDYEREFKPEEVKEWAYIKEVLSASKALDVAIDALKSIRDMGNELEDPKVAIKALQTISEIKKGNK